MRNLEFLFFMPCVIIELLTMSLESRSIMNKIKCPNCKTTIRIDEKDYDSIVKQVRDSEFEKEISTRERQYELDKENAIKITKSETEKNYEKQLSEKEIQITNLTAELKNKAKETETRLERDYVDRLNRKELEIAELKNSLKLKDSENSLAIKDAVNEKEKQIDSLTNRLENSKNEYLIKEKNMKESYEEKLKSKDEQISYYKDFKAKQSTKMIGESLEQHCSNEFNKLRPLFTNSYFEKDNDASSGSKGDFIFRDYDDDNTEIVSIMFEMKNEADKTATKHKNEDFFKELDKDRKEKKCEYAVLVSLLEIENDYYNDGIVDVSHKYEKMYVIRPQFFIPLITLIRGLAMNSIKYKRELQQVRNQNIDISHFEENMNNFKESFGRNYRLASDKFKKAIEEIDKTIDHLQKTKEALLSSENNLRIANNKAEDLTIKKLTRGSETMANLFKELNETDEEQVDA